MSTPQVAPEVAAAPSGVAPAPPSATTVETSVKKLRVPITVKVIISHVVLAALAAIVIAWTLISYFTADKTTYVRDWSTHVTTSTAHSARLTLQRYDEQVRRLAERLDAGDQPADALRTLMRDGEECVFAAIYTDANEKLLSMARGRQLADLGVDIDDFTAQRNTLSVAASYIKLRRHMLANTTSTADLPTFAVLRVARSSALQREVVVYGEFPTAPLLDLFDETGGFATYIVDSFGRIFAHPTASIMAAGELPERTELITALMARAQSANTVSSEIEMGDGSVLLAAFSHLELGGLGVVTERSKEDAYLAARQVTRQSVTAAAAVIALAIVISIFFSRALTSRLVELSASAERLKHGDFDVHVDPRENDELGDLATSFNLAAIGLRERAELDAKMRKGMLGQLAAISPVGLVQTLNCWRLTGTLVIDADGAEGRISFEQGDVNGAATDDNSSAEAFHQMMTWSTGGFFFEPGPTAPSDEMRIVDDTMGLIMESMQRIDEMNV